MRGSLVFEPNTSLALQNSRLQLENFKVKTSANETSSIASAILATRPKEGEEFAHDIVFDAKDFVPSNTLKSWIDPKSLLPAAFETMIIKSTAAFDAPWDRLAVEGNKPNLTRLDIETFDAKWGELQLQATGSLKVDTNGYPTGKLSVRAKNWKDMIQLAIASGAIDEGTGRSLETGLGLVAMLSGNKETLDIPLSFANRVMSLGPIPIGAAPRLKRY